MPFLVDFVSVVHSFYGVLHFSFFVLQWILQMGFLATYIYLSLGTSVYYHLFHGKLGLRPSSSRESTWRIKVQSWSLALTRAAAESVPGGTSFYVVALDSAGHLLEFLSWVGDVLAFWDSTLVLCFRLSKVLSAVVLLYALLTFKKSESIQIIRLTNTCFKMLDELYRKNMSF